MLFENAITESIDFCCTDPLSSAVPRSSLVDLQFTVVRCCIFNPERSIAAKLMDSAFLGKGRTSPPPTTIPMYFCFR